MTRVMWTEGKPETARWVHSWRDAWWFHLTRGWGQWCVCSLELKPGHLPGRTAVEWARRAERFYLRPRS